MWLKWSRLNATIDHPIPDIVYSRERFDRACAWLVSLLKNREGQERTPRVAVRPGSAPEDLSNGRCSRPDNTFDIRLVSLEKRQPILFDD